MRTTKVWAHRGASGYRPENTMEAFELAIKQGADGIELDVHTTADGKVVVIHDETLDRVTNTSGVIWEKTLAELKSLNICAEKYGEGFRIPTLSEVLDLMRKTDMMINIELKNSIYRYDGMEEKVMEMVKEMQMEDQIIYSTFNHYSLVKLKELNPNVKTGALISDGLVDAVPYIKKLGVDAIHPAIYHLLYPHFVEDVKKAGLDLHVWTADEPMHIHMIKDIGAQAVITDFPDRAIAIAEE